MRAPAFAGHRSSNSASFGEVPPKLQRRRTLLGRALGASVSASRPRGPTPTAGPFANNWLRDS